MARTKKLLGAYAAVGGDTLKRDRAITRFKDRLEGPAAFFDLDEITASSSMDEEEIARLIASLDQLSMGGGQRLVIVREAQALPPEARDALVSYLKDPNPESSLLLVADKLDARSKLYKAVSALGKGAIINCKEPEKRSVGSQVDRMAAELGLELDPLAKNELIDRIGANPPLLSRALRTIREQHATLGWVDVDMIRATVERAEAAAPWTVADAVISKDGKTALELIFESGQESHIGYHVWITRSLRHALVAKELEREGYGEQRGTEILAERFGARPQERGPQNAWRYRKQWRGARRFTRAELVELLKRALDVEDALKGSANGESELVRWVCEICE